MTFAYYNEKDRNAAQWIRNLVAAGHIAPGIVDERSIEDIHPNDLRGFTQCHFFAGVAVWSRAFRAAGWTDDRPVWSGSCPCQPFSAAGEGRGFADERHLWPAWFHLIRRAKPRAVPVFGEQVASNDGLAWLDVVSTDLEAADYAVGTQDLCAAGFGAPHIRQRIFFVADPGTPGGGRYAADALELAGAAGGLADIEGIGRHEGRRLVGQRARSGDDSVVVRLGDSCSTRLAGWPGQPGDDGPQRAAAERAGGSAGRLADDDHDGRGAQRRPEPGRAERDLEPRSATHAPGPTNGHWAAADWIFCTDGRWRPVEPGTQPLAHGAPARVGRLRAYGNAIVEQVAAGFIAAYMSVNSASTPLTLR